MSAWASAHGVTEELWYALKWGDGLSEVLLRRDLLRGLEPKTVPVGAIPQALLTRSERAYGSGGWCRNCEEQLERDMRRFFLSEAPGEVVEMQLTGDCVEVVDMQLTD